MTLLSAVGQSEAVNRRTLAARRANETRRARALAAHLFAMEPFDKDPVRVEVADFLGKYGRGPVADLHGPTGASARILAERDFRKVISCDTGGYTAGRIGVPRERLMEAWRWMADEAGYDFHDGDIKDVLPSCRLAYVDVCGPYEEPTSALVRAIADAGLWAFALTVELSRTTGGRDRGEEWYLRHALLRLQEDAPDYRVARDPLVYRGVSNIPMSVWFMARMNALTYSEMEALQAKLPLLWKQRVAEVAHQMNVGLNYAQHTWGTPAVRERWERSTIGQLVGPWQEEA